MGLGEKSKKIGPAARERKIRQNNLIHTQEKKIAREKEENLKNT